MIVCEKVVSNEKEAKKYPEHRDPLRWSRRKGGPGRAARRQWAGREERGA